MGSSFGGREAQVTPESSFLQAVLRFDEVCEISDEIYWNWTENLNPFSSIDVMVQKNLSLRKENHLKAYIDVFFL